MKTVNMSKLSGTETERKTGLRIPSDLVLDLRHAHCHWLRCFSFSFLLRDTGHSVLAAAETHSAEVRGPQAPRRGTQAHTRRSAGFRAGARSGTPSPRGQGRRLWRWAVAGALGRVSPAACPSTTTPGSPRPHVSLCGGLRPMPRARPTLDHSLLPAH